MISVLKTNKPIVMITSDKDVKDFVEKLDKNAQVLAGQVVIYFQNNFHHVTNAHKIVMKSFAQNRRYNFDVIYVTDHLIDRHVQLLCDSNILIKPIA
jgi:hypothetical protein